MRPRPARRTGPVIHLRTRTASMLLTAAHLVAGKHLYLSTGCLHGDHAYCKAMTGAQGVKRPGECKHCDARCICRCHATEGPR